MPLTPLSDFKGPPYRPKIPVIAGLAVVALLDATSVPLKWVGVITPSGSYVIASGIQQASWMLVVAVVVAALAIRLAIAPPATWVRCLFVALDFFVPLGMYLEYIDNLGRAESYTTAPYLGPGFYLALGATALLIGSTVLGWRERDEWIPRIQRRVD
jgi:hypothetical protein